VIKNFKNRRHLLITCKQLNTSLHRTNNSITMT